MSTENKTFLEQLSWNPEVSLHTHQAKYFILGGMGGSHLAAGLLKVAYPGIDIYVHRNYGLPPFSSEFLKQGLCIASSYSGNTEETVSFYNEAHEKGHALSVITSGGKLLELAQKNKNPSILLPKGLQPRDALGYSVRALASLMNREDINSDIIKFTQKANDQSFTKDAQEIAEKLSGRIPLVYSSLTNLPLAYIWKIKFNETTKIPAFYNCFPELNHNEMEGFDSNEQTASLGEKFSVILLSSTHDHPHVQKRMEVLSELYRAKNIPVIEVKLASGSFWHTITHAVELSDRISHLLASTYGVDPDKVPLVEDFKKRIS